MLVAGGSGTRLGFDGPKGTYPIGPVSAASLFQIHAEKIVAMGRRHGQPLPLYIMTSPENHAATARFFAEHGDFGLDHVRFFVQGQMPAVDCVTGKILLAAKGHVALEPRRPRRHLERAGGARPRRSAELPGRDARAGRPDALLLPGGQPAGQDRRPGLPRPPPPGRCRDVVQGHREALPRREGRRGGPAWTAARR